MTYDEIKTAWNAQVEDGKQWNSLTEVEKIEWAARLGAEKERGPAPIFHLGGACHMSSVNPC